MKKKGEKFYARQLRHQGNRGKILFTDDRRRTWKNFFTFQKYHKIDMLADDIEERTVSVSVSVLTLTCISIDRWYAICYPLRFRSTTRWAKTAIAVIWTVSFLFDIPDILVLHTVPSESKVKTILYTQCKSSLSHEKQTIFWAIKLTFLYVVPLIFMTLTYWQIVHVLWRSDIPGHNLTSRACQIGEIRSTGAGNPEGQLRSRRKAAKMLIAIVVTFAICYFPVHLLSILKYIILLPSGEWSIKVSLFAHWLCYVNSAVNPLIYNFMSGKFRHEFRRTFRDCTPTSNANGRHATHRLSNYAYRMGNGYHSTLRCCRDPFVSSVKRPSCAKKSIDITMETNLGGTDHKTAMNNSSREVDYA
ncbi:orexin receptor type 2-like isoform X3 [Vespa velutina]|uniref:orexin receptor type 2-like isoform X3 n=1 Tax=Vespa velutina TaxID=202808 RepID=UPI001FB2A346|nr:orexin receptor type 2-like isoform X3 [Vespa velutina]XP_047356594.1 orexin receptor type 2-like isoform X3 [Vespa velutina]XP_047356595.1 orexin receptor type 2-like isoform X3 [Vespa velutina]